MISTREEAIEWLEKYDHNFNYNTDNNYYLINDQGVVSCRSTIDICERKLSSLPLKFDHIDGDFICDSNKFKNFNNFPEVVVGGVDAYSNRFENYNEIPKEIGDCLNFLGKKNEKISNLDFVIGKNFGSIIIEYSADEEEGEKKKSIFDNNETPEKYLKYSTRDEDGDLIINNQGISNMIIDGVISDHEIINDYFDEIMSLDTSIEEKNLDEKPKTLGSESGDEVEIIDGLK